MGIKIKNVSRTKEVKANLKDMGRYKIEIGVFSESGSTDDGVHYALIAGVHEFGVTMRQAKGTIVIPERSFLRSTFDEKSDEWFNFVKKRMPAVMFSQMTAKQLMELLGAKIVSDIQKKIKDISDPPNAPSTIAQKGSSNPLIDTGGLRMRVTYKVVAK